MRLEREFKEISHLHDSRLSDSCRKLSGFRRLEVIYYVNCILIMSKICINNIYNTHTHMISMKYFQATDSHSKYTNIPQIPTSFIFFA